MGITGFSLTLLNKHGLDKSGLKVLELGCQNLYNQENYNEISNEYFTAKGQNIHSIDLEGCQGSEIVDLDKPIAKKFIDKYDVVTNFGTSEHCGDLYQTFKNIFDSCKEGGTIVCENPKTGHWPGHGNHYLTTLFYKELESDSDIKIIDIGEHPAMGNSKTGMNIYCVFKKTGNKFPGEKEFNKYTFHKK